MGEARIIHIELDERSILRRNPDVEQERKIAMFDLLEKNSFAPVGREGPFRIRLRVEESRLAIELLDDDGQALETIRIGLTRTETRRRRGASEM